VIYRDLLIRTLVSCSY